MRVPRRSRVGRCSLFQISCNVSALNARSTPGAFPASALLFLVWVAHTTPVPGCLPLDTYWDMAAGLVNNGSIPLQLFNDTNGEHIGTFAKIKPLLVEIRAA